MATYIKGDVHGVLSELTEFIDRFELNKKDTIIVLGDLGLYWDKNNKYANSFINYYEENYTTNILWIDGNHENFDLIEQLPDEPGTPFKRCSKHIHYIPRGTVFKIDTDNGIKTCLACGGADSVDKFKRFKHISWWEQETITDEDINKCINNIKDTHIDYVFTHCCPQSIFTKYAPKLITLLGIDQKFINHNSEKQLDKLMENIDFGEWYFAHYHIDKRLDDKFHCIFEDFIRI